MVIILEDSIRDQREQLLKYMRIAKDTNADRNYSDIRESQKALHKAQGTYETMKYFGALDDTDMLKEELTLIEDKITSVLAEKQRMKSPWKYYTRRQYDEK